MNVAHHVEQSHIKNHEETINVAQHIEQSHLEKHEKHNLT